MNEEQERGTYIFRALNSHECRPPGQKFGPYETNVPVGNRGDVWQCFTCQRLWKLCKIPLIGLEWRKVRWWKRWKYV